MNKQELNKCAQKLHEAYLAAGNSSVFDSPENNASWTAIFNAYGAKYYFDKDYADIISEVLLKAIKGYNYDSENDFENYFNTILKRDKKDRLIAERKLAEKETSSNAPVSDSDGNETEFGNLLPDKDESKDVEGSFERKEIIHNLYLMASELALKRPSGKTDGELGKRDKDALFYKRLVFTDMLTAYPMKMPDAQMFFSFNKTKLDNSVNLDFASSFFENPCAAVTDFFDNTFKPCAEFTHDERDADKPCASESNFARESRDKYSPPALVVLYICVYIAYVQAVTGKGISAGQISERRNSFFGALFAEYGNPFK